MNLSRLPVGESRELTSGIRTAALPDFSINAALPAGVKSELTDYSQKVRIEIVVSDEMVERLAAIIRETCHIGQAGDGVVWVTPVESLHRIRHAP